MIQGAFQFLSGCKTLLLTPELRSILWRMLALLFALMMILLGVVFVLFDQMLLQWLPQDDAWYWMMLSWVIWVAALLISALVGITGFTIVASAAVAPWLDVLATRTERLHGIQRPENPESWGKQSLAALGHAIRPVSILMLWGMVALFLMFIPIIGPIAAGLVWLYASIIFLCFELMDTYATRQGMSYAQRKQSIERHRGFWLGFGGMCMLWMSIPFLNILVIPAAVVALSLPSWQQHLPHHHAMHP